jgi:hypothetical protein
MFCARTATWHNFNYNHGILSLCGVNIIFIFLYLKKKHVCCFFAIINDKKSIRNITVEENIYHLSLCFTSYFCAVFFEIAPPGAK